MNTCSKDTECPPALRTSPSPGICAVAKVGPRLSSHLCGKTQSVTATHVTGCCDVTDDLFLENLSLGLNSGVLPHVQVYTRGIRSDVAWYELGLFY